MLALFRLSALSALLLATCHLASAAQPPNIVLVMCDDLGWGDVGFNGNKVIKTPHLDAMAAAGLKFDRFYAAAPVCSPTRGSVVTGRHPFRYGIYTANTGHMKRGEHTLAELLLTKGYRTGHFGKWHMGTLTKTVADANRGGPKGAAHYSPPQLNGFEVCFSTESKVPTWDPTMVPKKFEKGESRKNWWAPRSDPKTTEHYGTHYWDEKGAEVTENLRGDNSRVIMDRAVPFIEAAAKDGSPFFSVIWFHTPHLPVIAGPDHTALYPDASGHAQHYYGCISAMDEQVGRLRETLKKAGVADNTMVWFCSDNGPEGNDKSPGRTGGFRGRKRSLYEGGVRVPGLVEWPGVAAAGTSTDFPASTLDYLPTILGSLGIEMPDDRPTDGIDLRPAVAGTAKERAKAIGFQSAGAATLVTHRHKLYVPKNGKSQLYDLIEDPYEKNDLAAGEEKRIAELKVKLEAWKKSCAESDSGADYPEPKNAASDATEPLRFGAIADCQFANVPTKGSRHYRLAKEKLSEAVTKLNTERLDFTIHLGDFIDRDWASFDAVGPIFDTLRSSRYHLLGNHDFSVADPRKKEVPARLGMKARHYDFSAKGWRFIVLDGNEISTYAHPKDSPGHKAAMAYLSKFEKRPPTYNGAMGQEQIDWMKSKIEAARKAGERVILFNHFPVLPKARSHNLWNDEEVLKAIALYPGTVVAWINGHNHSGGYAERDGVHYITLHGMLNTKDNAFAVVEIAGGTLKVIGSGRQPSLDLKLPKPSPKASP